jgi:hypothetical protein
MGYGEFGSNGSMYWKTDHDDDEGKPKHADRDPVSHRDIGTGSPRKPKNHRGKIRVRLRFRDVDEFRAAVDDAMSRTDPMPAGGGWYIFIDVPVVPERADPAENPLWEVKVDW